MQPAASAGDVEVVGGAVLEGPGEARRLARRLRDDAGRLSSIRCVRVGHASESVHASSA